MAAYHGRNQYGEPCKTRRGESVKSKGEKQIADYFYKNGIKYLYEGQANTTSSAFRSKISRPDFRLLDYDMYVEYWGLVDVGDSEQRRRYQSDMRWKMSQYYNNGLKFISLYPWHLNDLEGAFKTQFKKVTGKDLVTGSINDKSVYALPIATSLRLILRNGIMAHLELSEVAVVYTPYYFVSYDCFAQGNFLYERVNLDSSGTVVLGGQQGEVVDAVIRSGTSPGIPQTGFFVDCEKIQAQETPRLKVAEGVNFSSLDALSVKITDGDARRIVQVEIAKNLSATYSRELKSGRVATKTIRPYPTEVRIVSSRLANVPIVTAVFRCEDKTYRLVLQSTTNRVLSDDLSYCNVMDRHLGENLIVCQDCGSLACKNHGKLCAICDKSLCIRDATARGLILRKHYCQEHVPAK